MIWLCILFCFFNERNISKRINIPVWIADSEICMKYKGKMTSTVAFQNIQWNGSSNYSWNKPGKWYPFSERSNLLSLRIFFSLKSQNQKHFISPLFYPAHPVNGAKSLKTLRTSPNVSQAAFPVIIFQNSIFRTSFIAKVWNRL